jgi:hypothetical protein
MDKEKIRDMLKHGDILAVDKILQSETLNDKSLVILSRLIIIFKNEVNCGIKRAVFDYSTDIDELVNHYNMTKLMLRRIEYDMPSRYIDDAYRYWNETGASVCMLSQMVVTNIIDKEKVSSRLVELYNERTGGQSMETQSFLRLYKFVTEETGNDMQ